MSLAPLRKLAGRAEALRYRWFAEEGPHLERALGLELWVPETVLGVRTFRTGALLAKAVARELKSTRSRLGRGRVLDMGAGTGVVGVYVARAAGARVVAVDLNDVAVRATRVNAMLNHVDVDARQGDLFSPLDEEERFDLVAFNPPFFGTALPGHPLRLALSDGEDLPVLDRFLGGVQARLAPGGAVLIAGSTNGALGRMRELFARHGFTWRTVDAQERIAERLVIDRLSARGA